MKNWEIDVAVLCIFFARPEQFRLSFEQVRRARPRTLLLWQDGPRKNRTDDIENIKKCREIAENIDWDCEIYRNYHDNNMGCDPSTFLSHKWAFSIVEKCIILEDDIVPNLSFFRFCKELLDRYENDTRIDRICGHTVFGGIPDKRYSYFFSRTGSSWGWASWRRVANDWQENYEFLKDKYFLDLAAHRFAHRRFKKSIKIAEAKSLEKKAFWEHIIGFRTLLQSGLVIYPAENMIQNVGASINATHSPSNLHELPREIQHFFSTPTHDIIFPLKHPPYIIEDYHYFNKVMRHIEPGLWRKIMRKAEHLCRKLTIGIIYFLRLRK